MAILVAEQRHILFIDVGWITDDNIEGLRWNVGEQIGFIQFYRIAQIVLLEVQRGDLERRGGYVRQANLGLGKLVLRGDSNTTAAAAKIENAPHAAAIGPGFEMAR